MTVTTPTPPPADAGTNHADTGDAAATGGGASATPTGSGRVAGIVGGHLLFYLLIWTGIGAVLLTVNLVANGVWGEIEASVWDGQSTVFQYAMLAGGIVVVTGYVPVIVSQGVTRRAAGNGTLVALAGLAVGGAVLTTLAFGVEDLVYALNDWPHVLAETEDAPIFGDDVQLHIYDRPDQYGPILVEVIAAYVVHGLAGVLIGGGIFRFGWLLGVPWLVGGTLLAVTGEFLMRSGYLGVGLGEAVGLEPPPIAFGILGTVALVAAGVLVARRLIRGMPLEIQYAGWWR